MSDDSTSRDDELVSEPPLTDETLMLYLEGPEKAHISRPSGGVDYKSGAALWVEGATKYQIDDLIARGGMGEIYEAQDLKCARSVALKVISKGGDRRIEDYARFVGEARITSQLEHPNIVPVHDLGNDAGGNVFYTMKHVKGAVLSDVLRGIRDGDKQIVADFPLTRLLTLFQKICDAMAFAHSCGIVHRDLKPGNIMIGDYGEVLVMDWGLAKKLDDSASVSLDDFDTPTEELVESAQVREFIDGVDYVSHDDDAFMDTVAVELVDFEGGRTELKTAKGTVMGTPGFLAPEQVESGGAMFNEKTDLYALGAILYSILTLRPPVTGTQIKEILRDVLSGDITPPSSISGAEVSGMMDTRKGDGRERLPHCPRGRVPSVLSDITMKALATDPRLRYPSVKDLQQDVEDYQNGIVWHKVVDEDFEDDVLDRWEILGGQYEIEDGELRLHGGEPQLLLLKQDLVGDVRIEFECRIESTYLNDVACLLSGVRMVDPWQTSVSGYAFKYGAYTNSFNVLTKQDVKLWSDKASPLVMGETYAVRAERMGNRLRMVVNGEEIFSLVDPEPLGGMHRGVVGLLGWVADQRITRIRVYSLGTPWRCDLLDAAERHLETGHYTTASDLFEDALASFPDAERVKRARKGLEAARHCKELLANLAQWEAMLRKAWPGVQMDLRVDRGGLTLEITNAGISDLSPLEGIPLNELHCALNQIESLEPLRGAPLRVLNCGVNPIRSLEPVHGAPLQIVLCEHCEVESLEPLRDAPLATLNCGHNPLKGGLDALQDKKLTWLHVANTGITTLEPLRGLPLAMLFCDGNEIEDLGPLHGMRLAELLCSGNQIKSLAPLQGMQLNNLNCANNQIHSLEPLSGMPLSTLRCSANQIESVDPLRDMSLNFVVCGANKLTRIGPLMKTPPKTFIFDCETLTTEELERIHAAWLCDIRHVEHIANVEVLLAIRDKDVKKLKKMASSFRGHRYLFIPKALRWEEARDLCEKLGGHLVTIPDKEVNDFLAGMFRWGGSWFWIGLYTEDGVQHWITGQAFDVSLYCHALDARTPGPKLFASGGWRGEVISEAWNPFVIEWDG